MLLSFAPTGPTGKAALLLRHATPETAALLRNAVEPLMAGISRRAPFHEIERITAAAEIRFAGVQGKAPGVRQTGPAEFVWEETLTGWLRVYDLLEDFTTAPAKGTLPPRELQSAGEIAVIISTGDS
jgi:hypothetical protein